MQQKKVYCFPVHGRWIAWNVLGWKTWECRFRASGRRAQCLINMTNQVIALSLCQKRTGSRPTAEMMARDWTHFHHDPHSGPWTQEELYQFLRERRGRIAIIARVDWVSVLDQNQRLSADRLSQCGDSWKHFDIEKMRRNQWKRRKSPENTNLCVLHLETMDVVHGPEVANQRGKGTCFLLNAEELSGLHKSQRRSQHNTTVWNLCKFIQFVQIFND